MVQLKLSNIVENIDTFEARLINYPILHKKYSKFISDVKSNKFPNNLRDTIFILLDDIQYLNPEVYKIFDYTQSEISLILKTLESNKSLIFNSLFDKLKNQKFKNKDFPVINLLEKSKIYNAEYEQKFELYKQKIKGFTNINKEFNLKTGDIIKFISGHNDDIIYISKILGFDSDGEAYMLWDCYWFPINLNKRFVEKI